MEAETKRWAGSVECVKEADFLATCRCQWTPKFRCHDLTWPGLCHLFGKQTGGASVCVRRGEALLVGGGG